MARTAENTPHSLARTQEKLRMTSLANCIVKSYDLAFQNKHSHRIAFDIVSLLGHTESLDDVLFMKAVRNGF
jgi:hypothetical protein